MLMSPRSSGDRAPPSGGGCTGSIPVGGTVNAIYITLKREIFLATFLFKTLRRERITVPPDEILWLLAASVGRDHGLATSISMPR